MEPAIRSISALVSHQAPTSVTSIAGSSLRKMGFTGRRIEHGTGTGFVIAIPVPVRSASRPDRTTGIRHQPLR